MGHSHDHHGHHHLHHHTHGRGEVDVSNLRMAFFLNLVFTIAELIGGVYINSMAVLSDALHDFGDSLSLGLAWYFQSLARRGRDRKYSYGYRRYSVLGALLNSAVLVFGSVFIVMESVPRLLDPEQPDATGMLFFAIAGIVINGIAVLRLRKGHSLNEGAVMLHLLEDVLGWVAVLIASLVMMFVDAPELDPILSLVIMAWVLFNAIRNLRKALRIFLQGTPANADMDKIRDRIMNLDNVESIHDLHLWSLDGEYNILTVHVAVAGIERLSDTVALKSELREVLKDLDVDHVTIEVEDIDDDCLYNGYEEAGEGEPDPLH